MKTVYLGGGTPTFLGTKRLTQILYALSLYKSIGDLDEFTIEANPDSLDERLVADVWAMGVNRISIGVQSFDDDVLRVLGRIHDAAGAERAIACAATRFDNISVDLMCGVPGQSLASFEDSLHRALAAGAKHISVYPLTIEPGTPFFEMVSRGELAEPDDDAQADAMECAQAVLEAAGMHRYEVASYAFDGYECQHNIAYWTGVPYLGLGPSAVSMVQDDARRMRKQYDMIVEDLGRADMVAEDLMLRMRMSAGVDDGFCQRALQDLPNLPQIMDGLVRDGLVEHRDGAWRPTARGWLCGNELYGAFMP